jgi:hypothetical protein
MIPLPCSGVSASADVHEMPESQRELRAFSSAATVIDAPLQGLAYNVSFFRQLPPRSELWLDSRLREKSSVLLSPCYPKKHAIKTQTRSVCNRRRCGNVVEC